MKKVKKTLLALVCAAALVVGSVAATTAYLTSTDEVNNTFTIGNVKIELDEARVGGDGKAVSPEVRVDKNSYKLIPGGEYDKDPTVTVKSGSEPCYVRALVTVTNYANLVSAFEGETGYVVDGVLLIEKLIAGWDPSVWQYVPGATAGTYEFRYATAVDASAADVVLQDLFTQVVIPGTLSDTAYKALSGVEVKVVANAIQSAGFSGAEAAWAAFDAS